MTLSLTPAQLWDLLSLKGLFDQVSLVNHPEVATYLLSLDQKELYLAGLYVDNRIPSQPTLYSSTSWKAEQEREKSMGGTGITTIVYDPSAKPDPRVEALVAKGFTLEQAQQIVSLMN